MSNKLQNIKAVKELLTGAHKSQTRKTSGFTKTKEATKRAVGDVWTEIDPKTPNPVISLQRGRLSDEDMGGTLRLGLYDCEIKEGTKAYDAYQTNLIKERHRHRYEFNNQYLDDFEDSNIILSGYNSEYHLIEMVEIKNHPWFVAVQFHPEFLSRPLRPHPLFKDFIGSTVKYHNNTK